MEMAMLVAAVAAAVLIFLAGQVTGRENLTRGGGGPPG